MRKTKKMSTTAATTVAAGKTGEKVKKEAMSYKKGAAKKGTMKMSHGVTPTKKNSSQKMSGKAADMEKMKGGKMDKAAMFKMRMMKMKKKAK